MSKANITTTINTKTGERLKGVKAIKKDITPDANFGDPSIPNMNRISKGSRVINEFINRNDFFNFNYYKDPEAARKRDISKSSIMYHWWRYDIRSLKNNKFTYAGDRDKIGGVIIRTDKGYRFVRDVIKPQFHLAYFTPTDYSQIHFETHTLAKNPRINSTDAQKEVLRFNQQHGEGKDYFDRKMLNGPYRGKYGQKINISGYFTVSENFFTYDPFGVTYEGTAFNKKSGILDFFHKAYTSNYPSRTFEDRTLYFKTDINSGRNRVFHAFPIKQTKLSSAQISFSDDLIAAGSNVGNVINNKNSRSDLLTKKPFLWSTDTSNFNLPKFSGLSKQEIDVENITMQFYKLFRKWYGIELIKQLQAPPINGSFMSRIKSKTQDPQLTLTRNYLYALSQIIVKGRYYYNPDTNNPDLSYQDVKLITEIN